MVNQRISIKDVDISLNGKIVGGAEEATVKISRENEVAYEGGNYMPVEIIGGQFAIEGTMNRAFVDVDLLNELMPQTAIPPSFTMTAIVTSGKTPGRNITIFGAVFDSIDINGLGLSGYAKNNTSFKALSWAFD
jgi:hypothetical protein